MINSAPSEKNLYHQTTDQDVLQIRNHRSDGFPEETGQQESGTSSHHCMKQHVKNQQGTLPEITPLCLGKKEGSVDCKQDRKHQDRPDKPFCHFRISEKMCGSHQGHQSAVNGNRVTSTNQP